MSETTNGTALSLEAHSVLRAMTNVSAAMDARLHDLYVKHPAMVMRLVDAGLWERLSATQGNLTDKGWRYFQHRTTQLFRWSCPVDPKSGAWRCPNTERMESLCKQVGGRFYIRQERAEDRQVRMVVSHRDHARGSSERRDAMDRLRDLLRVRSDCTVIVSDDDLHVIDTKGGRLPVAV